MTFSAPRLLAGLMVTLGGVQLSCSGPLALDDTPFGLAEGVERPAPGFVVEASPIVAEEALVMEVRAALTPADLVFEASEDGYTADIELAFRLRDLRGRETFTTREVADTLVVTTIGETRSDEPLVYHERFDAPSGRLMAEVVLIGTAGDARATRRFETAMPTVDDFPTALPPRIRRGDDFLVGPATARWRLEDSLRVLAEAYPPSDELPTSITLLRGRADLNVPSPPFWINPTRGSLAYRGAEFSRELDTVMVAADQAVVLLPLLEEGVYVVETSIGDAAASARRPLVVLPEGHPRLETIDNLVDALAYIAYPAEIDEIRDGITGDERRARFDAFWGTLFDVRALAEQTMRLYFGRIEEANRLFTSHKPGWSTDRGMIYVVFGPPQFVERTPDGETWRYGGRTSDTYFFERVRYLDAPWPMEHHVLRRSPRHEDDWQRAIRRWRRGDVR